MKQRFLAESTFTNYRAKARLLDKYFKSFGLESIRKRDVQEFIAHLDRKGYSNKTINEYLIVLRGVLEDAVEDGVITRNPMINIKNLKTLKSEPEPFSSDEIRRIIEASLSFSNEIAMFQLGVYCGLRISELLGLCWEDIDLSKAVISIRRAKVQGKFKTPKTAGSNRRIELTSRAVQLLTSLRALNAKQRSRVHDVTMEDNKTVRHVRLTPVFLNSNTGRPISNESHYAKYFFKPLLVKAGVRYRGPNTARHTFASQMLTKGLPIAWIASNLGHNSTVMLFKHYGKLIAEDAPDYSAMREEVYQTFDVLPQSLAA